MRVGSATATAATEILEAASDTARATSTAAMDILASATRAARATATAAADILDAVTKTTAAVSTAATDVLQVEVNRRRDELPFLTPSNPSPLVPPIRPSPSSFPPSYFNADGSTRLNRTPVAAIRYSTNILYCLYLYLCSDKFYIIIYFYYVYEHFDPHILFASI